MDIEATKRDWVGVEFDTAEFTVKERDMLETAEAVGEVEPRFCDPKAPDFQAIPTFTARFSGGRMFPEGFPRMGRAGGFDAGKCVVVKGPVRAGDRLTAKSQIADIYEKTGRSGSMIFIVHRMAFSNQNGEPVSVVDWRMVQPGAKGTKRDERTKRDEKDGD